MSLFSIDRACLFHSFRSFPNTRKCFRVTFLFRSTVGINEKAFANNMVLMSKSEQPEQNN